MAKRKLPYLPVYVEDDVFHRVFTNELRLRGFWDYVRGCCWSSPRRGHLHQEGGTPYSLEMLACETGISPDEAAGLMQRLIDSGFMAASDDGSYRCPRMLQRLEEKNRFSAYGRGGGNPALIGDMAAVLRPDDFYVFGHQAVFRAVVDCFARLGTADVILVATRLEEMRLMADVGGASALVDLWDAAPSAANALHYAEIVRDRSARRRLIHACREIAEGARDEGGGDGGPRRGGGAAGVRPRPRPPGAPEPAAAGRPPGGDGRGERADGPGDAAGHPERAGRPRPDHRRVPAGRADDPRRAPVGRQDLREAGVTVLLMFVYAPRDEATGGPAGPAIQDRGDPALAQVKVTGLKDRVAGLPDATILLDGDRWKDLPGAERRAVLDHELYHLEPRRTRKGHPVTDEAGRPGLKLWPHDFATGGFHAVARRHGQAAPEVQVVAEVARVWRQEKFDFWG